MVSEAYDVLVAGKMRGKSLRRVTGRYDTSGTKKSRKRLKRNVFVTGRNNECSVAIFNR